MIERMERHSTAVRFGWYSFVFTLGVIGNVYIACTILLARGMNSAINIFIANLAISDLGILLICLPVHTMIEFFSWPFGKYACRVMIPLNDVFFAVSISTMTIISWERYRVLVTPCKRSPGGKEAKVVIIVTWIVAFLAVGFPLSFITKISSRMDPFWGGERIVCGPIWGSPFERRMHIGFVVVCIVILLILTAFGYSRIIWVLKQKSSRIRKRSGHFSLPQTSRRDKSNGPRGSVDSITYRRDLYLLLSHKKIIKMVIIIAAVFWISILPLPIFVLISDFENLDLRNPDIDFIYTSFIAMFFTNSAFNPFAIYILSSDVRQRAYRGCLRIRTPLI